MSTTVAFLHTLGGLEAEFDGLFARFVPGAQAVHIADGTIIRTIVREGHITPAIERRLMDHVKAAAAFGADAIQFTCSTVSPLVGAAAKLVRVPVLSIDAPMYEDAVRAHDSIGMIATNPVTIEPSSSLLEKVIAESGHDKKHEVVLSRRAYEALLAGDRAAHDELLKDDLTSLASRVEVVCLAQASMARVAEQVDLPVPVLSSPEPAMRRLADVLARGGREG